MSQRRFQSFPYEYTQENVDGNHRVLKKVQRLTNFKKARIKNRGFGLFGRLISKNPEFMSKNEVKRVLESEGLTFNEVGETFRLTEPSTYPVGEWKESGGLLPHKRRLRRTTGEYFTIERHMNKKKKWELRGPYYSSDQIDIDETPPQRGHIVVYDGRIFSDDIGAC
jgi:hypothetical protein